MRAESSTLLGAMRHDVTAAHCGGVADALPLDGSHVVRLCVTCNTGVVRSFRSFGVVS